MDQTAYGKVSADSQALIVSAFMRRVYNWMTMGLALSGLIAWYLINTPAAMEMFFDYQTGPTWLFYGAIIGEFGLVIAISAGIRKFSATTAAAMFIIYSALNGATIGPVISLYTGASVVKAFLITAGMFAITSIWASTTKKDLSGMGSFLFMGLIGLILASVVNWFFHSPMMEWIISVVGVGIFVGLTAYDTQKLRAMVLEAANETTVAKMAVFGALSLYLDFINMFLFLLRLFGSRD